MWSTVGILISLLALGDCRSLPAPSPEGSITAAHVSGPTGLAPRGRSKRAALAAHADLARHDAGVSHARAHTLAARADWQYVGCVTDGPDRALPYYTPIGGLTPEKCQAECQSRGFAFAGTQYSNECYCGNALSGPNGKSVPSGDCSYTCDGDSSRKCGGSYRMSLYKDATASQSSSFVGCYTDDYSRTLPDTPYWGNSDMSIGACKDYCGQRGFSYAGVEYGNECYCGKKAPAQSRKAADSDCYMGCPQGPGPCGGSWRISVHRLSACTSSVKTECIVGATPSSSSSSAQPTATYPPRKDLPSDLRSLGCFRDAYLQGFGSGTTTTSNQPSICMQYCRDRNFNFAGLMGDSCTCSNSVGWGYKDGDAMCAIRCSGDQGYVCGGGGRISILSSTASSDLVSGTPQPVGSGRKYIWAHHMIGNLENGGPDMWKEDIRLAAAAGIDGFALNMGQPSWQVDRVAQAYQAALDLKSSIGDFKLLLSFDMTAMYCQTANDAQYLARIVALFKGHSQQAMYKDKILVTTFAGDGCRFGRPSAKEGWGVFRDILTAQGIKIYLMPSIFVDPFGAQNDWYDGHYAWDSAWPLGAGNLDGGMDRDNLNNLPARGKGYMANISPAFFTHYPPPPAQYGWNKNWLYRSDNWLLATRFEQLLGMRDKLDMIELTSWNDFGESHYVGPIRDEQPGSQGWVNGMPHTGWLAIVQYYAQAWKTGSYPTATDQLILWSRPHPKNGNPTNPTPNMGRPRNADYTDDNLYALAILSTQGDVTIRSGSNSITHKALAPGVHKLYLASKVGTIGGTISRGGANVKNWDSAASEFSYSMTFRDWNFNYFVKAI